MTDLVLYETNEPVRLISPASGEIISLADPEAVAGWVVEARMVMQALQHALDVASDALNAELDRNLAASVRVGEFVVKGETREAAEGARMVDIDALTRGLARLVREGTITREAARACVRRRVVREPAYAGLMRLSRHPAGRELLERVSSPAPRRRKRPTVQKAA